MRVFTIPSSVPFLRTLITALVDGELVQGFNARENPERLMHATMYLPTSRARTVAREMFLEMLGTEAVVLPRILTFDGIDEDEIELSGSGQFGDGAALELPPALGDLQRRLTLARLVAAWAGQLDPAETNASPLVVGGPASTLSLATDLARLMDDMVTRGVSYDALDGLVPDALDQYWQLTLNFLRIAREAWPSHLAEIDRIEPATRRDQLIAAEARRLQARQDGPVIAAGSTGSMPTTARFLHAIAQLPQGAVVLPGLDTWLEDDAWNLIGGSVNARGEQVTPPASNHPQHGMFNLLRIFGITRQDVISLREPATWGRELLTSETTRPSAATAHWHERLKQPDVEARVQAGMENLRVISAPNQEVEALAIAVAMREAYEQNKSASLITPDRALARRVMTALSRWQLIFDDSGGDTLPETAAGIFARLISESATEQLAPAALLGMLKHPLFRLGRAQGGWGDAIANLEIALLRGTRPAEGTTGLALDFSIYREELRKLRANQPTTLHRSELRARLDDTALTPVQELIDALNAALSPLEQLKPTSPADFSALARLHFDAIVAIGRDDTGAISAFDENDGTALRKAFADLEEQAPVSHLMVEPRDYSDVFVTAFGDRIVRKPQQSQARLRIFGTVEARLTQADRVILGSLVEGIWPPSPKVDPWLSRPMRYQLKLDLPERRIGLSAHDFAQLLGASDIIVSHASKVGGSPAVASRLLHRLEAVAGKDRWKAANDAGTIYVTWANALDQPKTVTPAPKPAPRPARDLRPLRMSVTEIEHWRRDPYTIYARHILKLVPLEPVDMPLSAADRGSAIHNAIGEFTETYADSFPDNAEDILRTLGEKHFEPLMSKPEAQALWWPRYLRIANWFAGWEKTRRELLTRIDAEVTGRMTIPLPGSREFILSARADRIEHRSDGSFALLDYKTGRMPSNKEVYLGLSPQLTLEGAIVRAGGFAGIGAGVSLGQLVYVKLSGNNPSGDERVLELKLERGSPPRTSNEAAESALAGLNELISRFDSDDMPYTPMVISKAAGSYGRYDDLSRVKEWSVTGGGDDGGEE